jgi:hypothetical protein
MDYDKLKSKRDYNKDTKIHPEWGWEDFKRGWSRIGWSLYHAGHVLSGQPANLVRAAGVSDRDKSQKIGRAIFWLIVVAVLLMSASAFATDPQPPDRRSSNVQFQQQQTDNTAEAKSVVRVDTQGTAISNVDVGPVSPVATGTGGESESRASAVAGANSATGGAGVGNGTVITDVSTDYDYPVAMAAPVSGGVCQRGLSGSVENGGFASIGTSLFCEYLTMHDAFIEARNNLIKSCQPKCEGICTRELASVSLVMECTQDQSDKIEMYAQKAHIKLMEADALVDDTAGAGKADRVAGQLVRPVAVSAGVGWLIRAAF